MTKEPYTEICKEYIEEIFIGAKEVFGDGIYVKCKQHPCGWDFISFESLESSDDMFDREIMCCDISDGCYNGHQYEGFTMDEIIKEVGIRGWCFELSGVDGF